MKTNESLMGLERHERLTDDNCHFWVNYPNCHTWFYERVEFTLDEKQGYWQAFVLCVSVSLLERFVMRLRNSSCLDLRQV